MKKNAFTLIELIGVITILGIILLITVPSYKKLIYGDTEKKLFYENVKLLISTTDMDLTSKNYKDEYTYTITNGEISNIDFPVSNTEGLNGSILYDRNGNVWYAIHNGVYCAKKNTSMKKAEITKYVEGECSLTK